MANKTSIEKAANVIKNAKSLIITAGAGMGVDSGLPDFRGPEGFWKAYPPLKEKGIVLSQMSNPEWFESDPEFAWGFFGHRYHLYQNTKPHRGFKILKQWAETMDNGYFVYTSNVDGHFQKAGFCENKVVECHGSINFMQCADPSVCDKIWPTETSNIREVNIDTLRMNQPLPVGPPGEKATSNLARPNILMFGDFNFIGSRTHAQNIRYQEFCSMAIPIEPFVVIEIGAGTAVPTIRYTSESLVENNKNAALIRINPNEAHIPILLNQQQCISLPMPGLEALDAINTII